MNTSHSRLVINSLRVACSAQSERWTRDIPVPSPMRWFCMN